MNKNCIFCLSVLILIPLAYSLSSSSYFDGYPDENYFKAEVVKCRNGSKKFRRAQLNDDFCDCPDGTDEPGTSACPLGKFYCWNAGCLPTSIYCSRVNDGICGNGRNLKTHTA